MVDLISAGLMVFEAVLPVDFGLCPAIDVAPNELGVTRLAYLVGGDRQRIARLSFGSGRIGSSAKVGLAISANSAAAMTERWRAMS
jgi:hypothetical protein